MSAGAEAYPKDVGRALAEYRKRRQLTLQSLSEEVGVSIATLSKLENGKALPSFRTLMRIVQRLDLSDEGRPVREPTGRKTVTRRKDVIVAHSDKGEFQIHAAELLHKSMFPMTSVISLRAPPPLERWARHPGEEFVYVLKGSIEVHVEHYAPYCVHEGESTYYDSDMRHVLVARGRGHAVVLSVSTSALSDEGPPTRPEDDHS